MGVGHNRVPTVWKVSKKGINLTGGQGKSGKVREIDFFWLKSQGKSGIFF